MRQDQEEVGGRARTRARARALFLSLVTLSACSLSPILSTMDDDDDTTTSSISTLNMNINGPDHHHHHHHHQYNHQHQLSSPPNASPNYNNIPSSTCSRVTLTTRSHSRPNMEEVWNDLNLVPLNEGLCLNNTNNHHPPNTSTSFGVHDFLGRSIDNRNGDPSRSFFGSHHNQMQQRRQPQQQQLSLGPVLNLNSSPGREFLADNFDPLATSSNADQIMIQPNPISSVGVPPPHEDHDRLLNDNDDGCPFQALASATRLTTFGRRRLQENVDERRHKRRIKNRESAARSRARREAYTNELELELSNLLAENSKLKRQHEKLRLVVDAQVARRRVLQRTSTAPF